MSTDLSPTITDAQVADLPLADARSDLLRELVAQTGAVEAAARPARRRWVVPVVAAAAVLAIGAPIGLSQLGGGDRGTRTATDSSTSVAPGPSTGTADGPAFQVRWVSLSSLMPPSADPERQELDTFVCPTAPSPGPDPVDRVVITCDAQGVKYLLGSAVVQGGVVSAEALVPAGQQAWTVVLRLDEKSTADLSDLTYELGRTQGQLALMLDGELLSTPTVRGVITTGQLEVSGSYTAAEAKALAARFTG